MTTDRVYGRCGGCDAVVYCDPGTLHGDGQIDTDASPVWLLGDIADTGAVEPLAVVECGCVEH